MSMKRFAMVAAAAAFGLGCGGDSTKPGGPPAEKPYPACPSCMHAQYVVGPGPNAMPAGITIPQSGPMAMNLGCDINNDGEIDNQLGKVLGALKTAAMGVDIQASADAAFAKGSIIILLDVEYTPSIDNPMTAGLKAYLGTHDPSDPLTAPDFYSSGNGKFRVTTATGPGTGGTIRGGAGDFGPGQLAVQFPLLMNQPPLSVNLQHAELTGTFSLTGIANGKICGAIKATDLKTTILPQVADLLSAQVKGGGSSADTIKSLFDTDHTCDTDMNCTAMATGACHCISEPEVENNTIIKSLLSPDLDLDPNANNPFVTDPTDPAYKNDALSLGLGFNANKATFPMQ
jgi:hypothetical protein